MTRAISVESGSASASTSIDAKINELVDWRGKMLAHVRAIILKADPEIVEEWKWAKATSPGIPVWSRNGIICTGETYKNVVKLTFAKGASLKDPSGLFNSSLEGNVRRAIDIHEGEKIDEVALKELIRAAVELNINDQAEAAEIVRPEVHFLFDSARLTAQSVQCFGCPQLALQMAFQ